MKNNLVFTSNGIVGTKFTDGFINKQIYPHYNKESEEEKNKITSYKEKISYIFKFIWLKN